MRIAAAAMAGLLVASIALVAFGAGSGRPKLTVVRSTVRGTHFGARERVTVRLVGDGRRTTRRTRTSASGRFAAQLPFTDPCLGPVVVLARGATGDSARLKVPGRACAPDRGGSG